MEMGTLLPLFCHEAWGPGWMLCYTGFCLQISHSIGLIQYCWVRTCWWKEKPIPRIAIHLCKNEPLAPPRWKGPNVVNLSPTSQSVSLSNGAILGVQHWSLLLTGWTLRHQQLSALEIWSPCFWDLYIVSIPATMATPFMCLYQFRRGVLTKCHTFGDLNSRYLWSYSSGSQKTELKVSAGLVPFEGCERKSLPQLLVVCWQSLAFFGFYYITLISVIVVIVVF